MSTERTLAVALGGVVGAALRWALLEAFGSTDFPVATFAANVLACFGLGVVVAWGRRDALGVGLATGFCGGLSTMSTLALEAAMFLDEGRFAMLVAYLVASLAAGVVALEAGRRLL